MNPISTEIATREILWNVGSLTNVVLMYSLMCVSFLVAGVGVLRHVELWYSGKSDPRFLGHYYERLKDIFLWGALQKKVVKERIPAVGHTLIYFGFLVLLFTTTMVFIDHDLGIRIYQGNFYLLITLFSDLFGIGLIFGCAVMAHRRYIEKADLVHNRFADSFFLTSLAVLCFQGFILEGLRIYVTNDPWAAYSPVGLLFAKFFWFLSEDGARSLHFITWWIHTVSVFIFLGLLPYTKFFHAVTSPLNLYFRRSFEPKGALSHPGDIEELIEKGDDDFTLGLGTIKDYSWKQLLELDACTSCGRCQDVCPAYAADKPLSPKWLILDSRNHALALHSEDKIVTNSKVPAILRKLDSYLNIKLFLATSGVIKAEDNSFEANGAFRAKNTKVQNTVKAMGANADDRMSGDVMDPEVFWSCTTCGACVEACPIGINHVEQIVGNRRNMVMMQGEVPTEAQSTLRALENRGNPYGPAEDRIKWSEGLDVPILKAGESVDFLYWVGCVSAFDPRKQKIAQALVKIFNKVGLSYGILGNIESCTGDPARRLGDENLYQLLAKQNIKSMKEISFKNIVTNCPHCFNTIKNEYPQIDSVTTDNSKPKVFHHTQLLQDLLAENRIPLKESAEDYTFHDPCYLGRYNDEYEAPRKALTSIKSLRIIEMEQNKEKGMCCGAGGGHFWMDKKEGERVNVLRINQAVATGVNNVATACPFCMQMLEDGAKITNQDENIKVRDIAEVLADNLA